jgi:hypothetical protein
MISTIQLTLLVASALPAAPPKLDYFYPAGAQRGEKVEIVAAGTFTRWPVQVHVEGSGITVEPAKASGKLVVAAANDAVPGPYWIRLYDAEGATVARPFIVGTLSEINEQEPNDDPKKPQLIKQPAVVVNGRLEKLGDVDTYAVKLAKGQTLVASVEAHRVLRSPIDTVLQILSADGFVLEQNDDYHGFDPQVAFEAPRDETYLVRVFAFPAVPDSSVRFFGKENAVYRLTLTTGPFVDTPYPLAVTRSTRADVQLIGWNIPDALRRYHVAATDQVGSLTLFEPRIANPFSVRVEPHAVVTRTEATREKPQSLTVPVTVTGKLERRGAVDVFEFNAKKGEKLGLRAEALTLGFPLDPVLRVADAAGKTLAQTKPGALGADASLDYTVPRNGAYRLEISDLSGGGGPRYLYRLRAAPLAPDFDLKIASDTVTVSGSKQLEIPITVTRVAGHSGDIGFSIVGLPKEITAIATAKGLTLTAEGKAPFSGPMRIVGTATGGTTRFAQATVAELGRTTDALSLTAIAK